MLINVTHINETNSGLEVRCVAPNLGRQVRIGRDRFNAATDLKIKIQAGCHLLNLPIQCSTRSGKPGSRWLLSSKYPRFNGAPDGDIQIRANQDLLNATIQCCFRSEKPGSSGQRGFKNNRFNVVPNILSQVRASCDFLI